MKNAVLGLLLTLLSVQFIYAQSAATRLAVSLDSIQYLVNAHPKDDTTKVNLLNTLARFCFYDIQLKRGIVNAKVARQIAQKINYRKGEGLYLRALEVLNSQSPHWLYFESQTRWFYERIGEKETVNPLEVPEGLPLDFKKISTELSTALTYARQQQDNELTAIFLQLISTLYAESGRYKDCLSYADQAIQLYQKIGQPIPGFFVLTTKMRVLEELKQVKDANAVEKQVINIIAQTRDSRDKALLCFQAGRMFRHALQNKSGLALEYLFKANTLLEQVGETQLRVEVLNTIGYTFNALVMYSKAVDYYTKGIPLLGHITNYPYTALNILMNLSYVTIKLKQFNQASRYINQVSEIETKWGIKNNFFHHETRGEILMYQGRPQEAIPHFHLANEAWKVMRNTQQEHPFVNLYIGQCYLALGNYKESIVYGEKAYKGSFTFNRQELVIKTSLLLTEAYDRTGQPLKAYEFLKIHHDLVKANEAQDVVGRSSMAEIESIIQKSEQEKAALEREKLIKEAENQNQRWWLITAVGILISVFVLMLVLYRNNRQKQKINSRLQTLNHEIEQQKEEIETQRDNLENTLNELQLTQTQLIQKEKLASLGELTAGIAHEIQNPLNFVNNFSEVSTELIDELKEGPFQKLPDDEKQYAEEILGDLTSNLKKINHHGGRASSIVKGMLEHSRTESGEKRPTDLNALADEYLKIAYHGMRAKNKEFNCELVTDFDPALEPVAVAPQEIGRVLLNLYNNAFYALSEKAKKTSDADYKPTVTVRTKQAFDQVVIRVSDNGTGIPNAVKAKIFQPFFTTKPTGEGTGLGLSLSYDIITKGHTGTLQVISQEGQGTEFIIQLPQ
ncbi:tetratricopeptide repeat-containing sensor histidine kinase [Spirosoma flavus]